MSYNCLQNIITPPNPCAGSNPCIQNYDAQCVIFNGTLTCGGFGPNPSLNNILSGFCSAFTNISNEITTINTNITNLQGDQVFTAKIVLTAFQVQNLHSTPIELIAAPTTGLHIQVLGTTGQVNFGTTPYAAATLQLIEGPSTSQDIIGNNTSVMTVGSSLGFTFEMTTGGLVALGANVRLFVPIANPTLGDSGLTIYVTYKLITL